MHLTEFFDLETALLRRFQAACECDLSPDELADFAELDAAYESEMDRMFADQLAERGMTIEAMMANMSRPVGRDGAAMHCPTLARALDSFPEDQ